MFAFAMKRHTCGENNALRTQTFIRADDGKFYKCASFLFSLRPSVFKKLHFTLFPQRQRVLQKIYFPPTPWARNDLKNCSPGYHGDKHVPAPPINIQSIFERLRFPPFPQGQNVFKNLSFQRLRAQLSCKWPPRELRRLARSLENVAVATGFQIVCRLR